MPAILLSAILLCATTIAWAQHGASEAPESPHALESIRDQVFSAIRASLQPAPSWQLLGTLADAAALPDRSLSGPAARAASDLVSEFDAFDVDEQEIPRAELQAIQLRWLHVATDQERWVDIRVYALEVASHLDALLLEHGAAPSDALWRTFLEDADPQMRAAALTLIPDASGLLDVALKLLAVDDSEEVALAAGQRVCGPLGKIPTPLPPLELQALGRLQVLAANRDLPIATRSNLAPCLVADGSLESRRALGVLLQKSPPALRRQLNELTRRPKAPKAP